VGVCSGFAGGSDGAVKLWDVASGKNTATLKGHTGSVNSVAFSPDGKILASASNDATIDLWDVATGKNTATLEGAVPGVSWFSVKWKRRLAG
jgi:WD40 repeat protein